MRTWLCLLVCLTAASVVTASVFDYKLDLKGPLDLTAFPPQIATPTRVEVYLTGPRTYIDKSITPASLSGESPLCMLTNATEISNLVSVLRINDNKARITDVPTRRGYTYHILLFQDADKTVMHFRVFKPTEIETPWCDVNPRSDTGFGYFNDRIGAWLSEHAVKPELREGQPKGQHQPKQPRDAP